MAGIRLFFQLFLCFFIHALSFGQVQAQNRTFSLVAINSAAPAVDNKNVVRASNTNPSGVGIGFTNPGHLTVFLYNQQMYMKCASSPTGVCIGYFQKNFGGALRGWNFQFWVSEDFPITNPLGSYAGRFGVQSIDGLDFLVDGVDAGTGLNGTPFFQLCPYPGVPNSPYAVCIYLISGPWIGEF